MTGARILSLVTPSMSPIAPRPRRRAVALTVVVVSGVALAGCGDGQPSTSTPQQATGGSSPYAPITVYAAASLHQVFDEIGARVEQETGADIQFSYAGSSDLAAQLGEGGPGDVFASANEKQMTVAVDNGSVAAGTPKRFLEHILLEIRDAGVISSKRGRAGGYVMVKRPGEVKLSELLRLIDGPLAPLPCLSRSAYQRCPDCTDEETCRIRKTFADVFWTYLLIIDSLTLADLMRSGELASRVIAEP